MSTRRTTVTLDERKALALGKEFGQRTIEDWIVVLYTIYQDHNRTCGPYDLWLQVVNDGSQLAETIRREIIRSGRRSEPDVYSQLARLFCRISAFIGRYVYDFKSVGTGDAIGSGLVQESLDDYIGGEERYEKWILLKYPSACPTCGSHPCVCAAYRNIMENRSSPEYDYFWERNKGTFMEYKKALSHENDRLSTKVKNRYDGNIDSWVQMFYDIYTSSHIEIPLESIAFHFLEEVGEVSDGILCVDELFKCWNKRGVYKTNPVDLYRRVKEQGREREDMYRRFLEEHTSRTCARSDDEVSEKNYQYLLRINMSLIKEELADVFSWMCAILNKIRAMDKYWNPSGKQTLFSETLEKRYSLPRGEPGCSYCSRAVCQPHCLIGSAIRKSMDKRSQKLAHHLFS